MDKQGPGAVTTRGVAEAAGVQAPTIYRLFGDKDGLLDAVAEHQLARYVGGKSLSDESDDPVADLRVAWQRHVDFGLHNPALFTLLADPDRTTRSPAAMAGHQILASRVHRLAAAGQLRVSERRAVDLIHAAGTGVVHTLLAAPVEDRDPLLADTLFNAVLRAVLTDLPADTMAGNATDSRTAAAVGLRAAIPDLAALTAGERNLLAEWLDRIAAS